MENLNKASGKIQAKLPPPKFVSKILCCVALVYNSCIFFQNSRFTEISRGPVETLASHTNTKFSRGCLIVNTDGFQDRDQRDEVYAEIK